MSSDLTAADQLIVAIQSSAEDPAPIVLLRHSIREPIRQPTMTAALEAPLTDAGRDLARALGPRLASGRPARVYHSPAPRCEETARLLAQGLEAAGDEISWVGGDDLIAAPYLNDPQQAVDRFASLGMAGFVRAWVGGELPPQIIDPMPQAAVALLAGLTARRAENPEALHLHVTHDLTIVTLLGLVVSVEEPGFEWPGYLEGCVLRMALRPELTYRGRTLPLALPSVLE